MEEQDMQYVHYKQGPGYEMAAMILPLKLLALAPAKLPA
jgi:hypothetical protein